MLRSIRRHKDAFAIGALAVAVLGAAFGSELAASAPTANNPTVRLMESKGPICWEDGSCASYSNTWRISPAPPIVVGFSLKKARAQITQRELIPKFVGSDAKPRFTVTILPDSTKIAGTYVGTAIFARGSFYTSTPNTRFAPDNRWTLLTGNESPTSILVQIRGGFYCKRGYPKCSGPSS